MVRMSFCMLCRNNNFIIQYFPMKAAFRYIFFSYLLLAAVVVHAQQPGRPMNIVFILSDDHRYDAMGFMNKIQGLQTPGMDRMAREGAHLKNAFVSTALCSP